MLEKIALNTIYKHNLICNNDHIIVGVSGGADSICLLHFLYSIKKDFNLKITAVHINHCMRGEESDQDNKFVVDFCKNINIPIKVFSFDIYNKSKEENISIEETGRKYRYFAFNKVLKEENATKIAIAHNKDDNAETILMRFFRGTGIKGLSGISYKRDNIIRPILDCLRKDIEKYCDKNNLSYRNDSTNSMDIYTRNKIRLNLIPTIKKDFNPNIIYTLSNMAKNFYEENNFLDNLANTQLNNCLIEKNNNKIILNLDKLKNVDLVIQKRLLRLCLSHFNKDLYNLSFEHINMIINILQKQTGKKITLPNNLYVYKQYSDLIITKDNISSNNSICYNYKIELEKQIYIKELNKHILLSKNIINISPKVYTISLNYDKIKNSLFIRQRNAGDKIYLNNMTKKIKNIFIDLKIPANERNLYPILLDKDKVIGILGLCLCSDYKPSSFNNTVYLHTWEEN
ncbi:tRNA lysidine(34) synthetase TilS [uncultured Tyzzerella sp.]|uniref:tRNA lysidine(34) synthetase TilS n=1 Tax=uncultured Tyzzerella sp. TaxID=2321398 RepID=UPI002943BBAA|nr:tRNA lysidine(34) synthetase TilS [uncultured Tyzzerella sp.]